MTFHLTDNQQKELLELARQSIIHGCDHSTPLSANPDSRPAVFQTQAATFVTLQKKEELRGCIGTLQAYRSLIEDIVQNAFASAFKDHRFFPVTREELKTITIEVSVLSPQVLMDASTEQAVMDQLTPGIDGLVIHSGVHSATFLPQVWEQLPDRDNFLRQLKRKAGLHEKEWPEDMKCFRYYCYKFSEHNLRT